MFCTSVFVGLTVSVIYAIIFYLLDELLRYGVAITMENTQQMSSAFCMRAPLH